MRNIPWRWRAAAFSALLQVLIFPALSKPWLAWAALAPLIWAVLASNERNPISAKRGFWLGYFSGVLWFAGTCPWLFHTLHIYGKLPSALSIGLVALFSLYLGLYHGLFGCLLARAGQRWGSSGAAFAAPFLWVAVEFARYYITGVPWNLLGTAVVDNIALSRLATVTGVYGLSFVIIAVNAMLAAAMLGKRLKPAVTGLVAAVALQSLSLYQPPASPALFEARLVQPDLPIDVPGGWTGAFFDKTMAELVDLSQSGRKPGPADATPRLIIWPEAPAPFFLNDPKFRTWMGSLAGARDSYVITGSMGVGDVSPGQQPEVYNSAGVIAPNGVLMGRYDKVHLVPFGEYVPYEQFLGFAQSLMREVSHFERGTERKVIDVDRRKIGIFICYESSFPGEVRQFAANGAEVFVNISNDLWFGDYGAPEQHLNQARMRAIENQRWLLRATNSGITAVVDPYGRVVSRLDRHARGALDVAYSFESRKTFYTRYGDWFPWMCAILSLGVIFIPLRRRASR